MNQEEYTDLVAWCISETGEKQNRLLRVVKKYYNSKEHRLIGLLVGLM